MFGVSFQRELDKRKVVSAQPGVYLGDLAKISIQRPCIEEQQKIASYLSGIDTKIESVNNQITQTQTFKKGLLQQLFV
jgi:type I restriction enzyme S subunit